MTRYPQRLTHSSTFYLKLSSGIIGMTNCLLFCDKYGNLDLSTTTRSNPERFLLADWVKRQRMAKKLGLLAHSRIEFLNRLRFDWSSSTTAVLIQEEEPMIKESPTPLKRKKEMMEEEFVRPQDKNVKSFEPKEHPRHEEHEDVYLPDDSDTEYTESESEDENFKPSSSKRRKLCKDYRKVCWMERFGELIEWRLDHGHCMVPQKSGSLGLWVRNQRYERRKGNMPSDRINLLNDLQFEWEPTASKTTRISLLE